MYTALRYSTLTDICISNTAMNDIRNTLNLIKMTYTWWLSSNVDQLNLSLFDPAGLPVAVESFSHLSFNLCKWCEVSSPVCKDSVCFTNCTLSSFCNVIEEICITIWWVDPLFILWNYSTTGMLPSAIRGEQISYWTFWTFSCVLGLFELVWKLSIEALTDLNLV